MNGGLKLANIIVKSMLDPGVKELTVTNAAGSKINWEFFINNSVDPIFVETTDIINKRQNEITPKQANFAYTIQEFFDAYCTHFYNVCGYQCFMYDCAEGL